VSGFVSRTIGFALVVSSCMALASCGLPRSGPSKAEILGGEERTEDGAFVLDVTQDMTRAMSAAEGGGFPAAFLQAGPVGSDVIHPGDALTLQIWENVEDGLLSNGANAATTLQQVQVDAGGFIFVPYAGRLRAAGLTPEGLRDVITRKLADQTPDPQVAVARKAGDGATVTLLGAIGGQGVYPIERPTRHLSGMLATAGGVSVPAETARVTLRRSGRSGAIWLDELYADPRQDIALRPGDVIVIEEDRRSFIALGATGGQQRVPFDRRSLSALDAIARAGGLASQLADPTGIFVLREEPATTANRLLKRGDLTGPQRMIYTIDLTGPDGLFVAGAFDVRDGDTIYVTEAPYVRWQKALQVLTGSIGAANSVSAIADN